MGVYVGDKRYAPYVGNKRGKVMIGKALPYDAEIEYLESTGTQWIDLPFGFDPTDEIEASFILSSGMNNDKYINSPNIWNTSNNRFGFGAIYGKFCFAYGAVATPHSTFSNDYDYNNIHTWVYSNKILTIPSLGIERDVSSISFGSTTANIRLFWGYNSSTKGKLSYYKHMKANNTGVHLIAVRVGQVGYMYDKVSGELFGNDGTGDFVLGPDINN